MTRFSKGQNRKKNKHDRRRMYAIDDDERFLDLSSNIFREQKRKERKVIIDDRFKQMLNDKRFEERDFTVDKRGKPSKKHANNFLTHLYELDKGKEDSELSNDDADNDIGQNQSNEELSDKTDSKLKTVEDITIQLDLARGEAPALFSSSSEDEDDNAYFDENDDKEEIDTMSDNEKDVRHVEWASSRLAICNMDWNKLDAEDLFIVLNSFKPSNGIIYTVSVYLSDFGAERLEDEKKSGPKLKLKSSKKGMVYIGERTKEAIRNYESERLRYYYAVCECDSTETATAIYEACDGVEYGASGIRFDIRFVSDETKFEEKKLQSRITLDDLNLIKYKPKRTITHSLQLSNPKISWEEKDIERRFKMKQAFEKEAKLDEFELFIAPGSDEDDEEEHKNRYEKLIAAAKEATETKGNNVEKIDGDKTIGQNYEIDFDTGVEKIIGETDSEDEEQKSAKKKTKFQIYLDRKKQLKIERKHKGVEKKKSLKRKKTKQVELDEMEKTQSSIIAQVEQDERFDAFFTDSAYAIDTTHAQYKGRNLAITQVYGKKARNKEEKIIMNNPNREKETEDRIMQADIPEILINRLIAKQKRQQKENI